MDTNTDTMAKQTCQICPKLSVGCLLLYMQVLIHNDQTDEEQTPPLNARKSRECMCGYMIQHNSNIFIFTVTVVG